MKMFVDVTLISSAILIVLAVCGWISWARSEARGDSPDVSMGGGIIGMLAVIALALLWLVFGIVCIVRWIWQAA